MPRQESSYDLGKMPFHGNIGCCLEAQDIAAELEVDKENIFIIKNSLATYYS